jgi:perosamine synthetase
MDWKIPLFKIHWDDADVEMTTEAIKMGGYWAIGPNIAEFEKRIAQYLGTQYAIAVNSGTSALHAVLAAHEVGDGDEVIVPAFTFIATANSPLFVGAKPVFADIEEETYGLKPEDVERKITPHTKAILPIHYAGGPCQIEELKQIAQAHNLLLIEDAAQSMGAMVNGKKVGTFGDSAILSFCAPKIITTGEGGAVVTDSADLYERLKLIRSHGRAETANYFTSVEYMQYVTLGYNFRMSNISAALGLAQIGKIDKIIQMRRENAAYLTERLSGIDAISLPVAPQNHFHVYSMYTIRVKGEKELRDKLMAYLNENGIMARIYHEPVHLTHFYRQSLGYKGGELPVTEIVSRQVLTLPFYPDITKEEMDYIAEKVGSFFSGRQ